MASEGEGSDGQLFSGLDPPRSPCFFPPGQKQLSPASLLMLRGFPRGCSSFQTIFLPRNKPQKDTLGLVAQRGFSLEEYFIGQSIGKGCSGAVYEAAAPATPTGDRDRVPKWRDGGGSALDAQGAAEAEEGFPLAIKMMWNISVRNPAALLAFLAIYLKVNICT